MTWRKLNNLCVHKASENGTLNVPIVKAKSFYILSYNHIVLQQIEY